ncbi:ABC transporter ATP-binding protein [Mesorhizobium sp.]|uniref:ABC transporter transmembrane domain-containing protein n=1 Tax=Mesorhizobium sp. TaxID=1871066 RepID=UPI000FE9D4CA|nr:ABC transporter ATP-binding protein [Mesorhizobium sp.]RWM33515.1 MAG: ABC transporter ATP-binding protein [Mesorhizobium sp.]TIO73654.1 MAG: ABC transporter ATP-binding protein [Mesorhizobium sp.]TIO81721.1 MAG: ABC transporter ATP-binding protein [Mesorhizobium sp.]TJV48548.1 MAG: ABC transporter ATP-binding protein [Mesorhizobium sp.]
MEPSLARYIWLHTKKQQAWILMIVLLSMIPYFISFDLPKLIVNGPIQGKGFGEPGATQPFMRLHYDLPFIGEVQFFSGFQLDRTATLFALSTVFLLLVVINGLFKLYINTYKGRLGERMLRRIRYDLVDRVLRFPPTYFKRVKSAEVATMVKDEVEPLGGFIGDAFVQPVLLGGQALTAMLFIVVQNFWLGMIAAVIVVIQIVLIPRMRRRLIVLGRERQLTARALSGRVGEIVDGIGAVHVHDTSNYERADIAARLGLIFKIRFDLYQWKFMVKFLNNFLAQVTPFLFYMIGGYLALQGRLDVGQLVAVISAYKDLPGPMKELIDWDQARQDVQVKYQQVVEQFTVEDLIEPRIGALTIDNPAPMTEPLSAISLSMADDGGAMLLDRISLQVKPGETVALVSTATGGAEALAEAFARLNWPDSGRIASGADDLLGLPEAVTGRRMSYASSDVFLFQASLRDNLLYGLKHAPLRSVSYDGAAAEQHRWNVHEARRSGNPDIDIRSDWIDYASAGATGPHDLFEAVRRVLDAVLLSRDILDLGLRSSADLTRHTELARRIVELRGALRTRLEHEGLSGLVVPFEPGAYNKEATIGQNLLFGAAAGPELADKALAANPYFASVLRQAGLDRTLYEMGMEIADQTIELFADLPPDHQFFQQLAFMSAEEIPAYETLLQRLKNRPYEAVSENDRAMIVTLSFAYIEPRHRFGLLSDELMSKIVAARNRFYENLPPELQNAIERYDPAKYIAAATVMDNVLFGRVGNNHPDAPDRIRSIVYDILEELGLYSELLDVGLDFNVGAGGRRLTAGQRQKLDVARALLKRPDFLILNRPLSALDQRVQDKVLRNVLEEARCDGHSPAIVWVVTNPVMGMMFDRVIVFDSGQLVEDGTHETLLAGKGIFKELLS